MTVVFVGGSRMARLTEPVRIRLNRIVADGHRVVVGDANGIDKAVQDYLASQGYTEVFVYCSGDSPRNNLGSWPVRSVAVGRKTRDRKFYAAKDRAMALEASHGLMVWDGESVGTLQNVLRLLRQGKPVVLYETPSREFRNFKVVADWEALRGHAPSGVVEEAERAVDDERSSAELFPDM